MQTVETRNFILTYLQQVLMSEVCVTAVVVLVVLIPQINVNRSQLFMTCQAIPGVSNDRTWLITTQNKEYTDQLELVDIGTEFVK